MSALKDPKQLTKWEAGQELVKANDAIHEALLELKNYPDIELTKALRKARAAIVRVYKKTNMTNEMGFGI